VALSSLSGMHGEPAPSHERGSRARWKRSWRRAAEAV
jgi:hypothetical protein